MVGRQKRALGTVFGLANFGVNPTQLAPGAISALRHAHTHQDEFFHVLQGRPVLRTDAGRAPLASGRAQGFKQIVGSPDYARFECPAGDATFCPRRTAHTTADTHVVVCFERPEFEAEVRRLQVWPEARLQDPSGNVLCLFWAGENRKNPPRRLKD